MGYIMILTTLTHSIFDNYKSEYLLLNNPAPLMLHDNNLYTHIADVTIDVTVNQQPRQQLVFTRCHC